MTVPTMAIATMELAFVARDLLALIVRLPHAPMIACLVVNASTTHVSVRPGGLTSTALSNSARMIVTAMVIARTEPVFAAHTFLDGIALCPFVWGIAQTVGFA